MKRYSLEKIAMPDDGGYSMMRESPTGEYYSRADLIAAGVLVPVPDGEACRYWDRHPNYFIFGGHLLRDNGHAIHPTTLNFEEFEVVGNDDKIQPVRLVKLEDVE